VCIVFVIQFLSNCNKYQLLYEETGHGKRSQKHRECKDEGGERLEGKQHCQGWIKAECVWERCTGHDVGGNERRQLQHDGVAGARRMHGLLLSNRQPHLHALDVVTYALSSEPRLATTRTLRSAGSPWRRSYSPS